MALAALLRRMTPLDRLIVLVLLLASAAAFALIGHGPRGTRVVVERQGQVIFSAPLGVDRTVTLNGPLGETQLRIRDGHAGIISSPCAHKVCIGMGQIAQQGELLACVPNDLLVRIEGQEAEEPSHDLISR
ncbi:MAG: NusG domain II-containing protein [Desulfuromonadaceae bacterium]